MKKFILLALFGLSFVFCKAQDIITLKNGTEITAKITEVNFDNIRYKDYNNLDGPIYTIAKNTIFMLKYSNGKKEVISSLETNSPTNIKLVHFRSWSIDGGASNLYNKTTNNNYTYNNPYYNGVTFGFARQWGVITSAYTGWSIGVELHSYNGTYYYNSQSTYNTQYYDDMHVMAAGIPLSFSFTDTKNSDFYANITLSPGIRYTFDALSYPSGESTTNETTIKFMGRSSFSAGFSLKTQSAIFQFGPYLDYILTSNTNSNISHIDCYGFRISIIKIKNSIISKAN